MARAFNITSKLLRITCQCGYVWVVNTDNGSSDLDFCPECDRRTGLRDLGGL